MQTSIINQGGYWWLTRPPSGETESAATLPRGVGPNGWYGGAGPGGMYKVSTPAPPAGAIPGSPPTMFRLVWTASPTAGNAADYGATGWATYWEQFDLMPPDFGMGRTMTRRLHVRQTRTYYTQPLPMRPIYWYSAGGMQWASVASAPVYLGEVFQCNGYCFEVTVAGTLDATAPTIPANQALASPEVRGSATILCRGPMKGNSYEIFEAAAVAGEVKKATGDPPANRVCNIASGSTMQEFVRSITMPEIGSVDSTTYAGTDWPVRTILPPQRRGARPYFGSGIDLDMVGMAPEFEFFDIDGFGFETPQYRGDVEREALWTELLATYPSDWINAFIGEINRTSKASARCSVAGGVVTQQVTNRIVITRNSVGNYTATFTKVRPHANYRVHLSNCHDGTNLCILSVAGVPTTSGFGIYSHSFESGALVDCGRFSVDVFDD